MLTEGRRHSTQRLDTSLTTAHISCQPLIDINTVIWCQLPTDMKTKRTYTMSSPGRGRRGDPAADPGGRVSSWAATTLVSEISLEDGRTARRGERADRAAAVRQPGRTARRPTASTPATVIAEERRAPVGDVPAAVRAIVDHYEHARRRRDPDARAGARRRAGPGGSPRTGAGARAGGWRRSSRRTSPPAGQRADALVDLLVVATDVYTWKLLRRDQGASRAVTEQRMEQLVRAVLDLA